MRKKTAIEQAAEKHGISASADIYFFLKQRITVKRAAEKYGVSVSGIHHLIKTGRIITERWVS